ncbi:hypothetical protein HDF12_004576 [Edaphobacter lichenicola]|uniref:Uncharacterized protein n=1 Tax=Tunturiibacter lichenicola TaxID=2051959 RepID=A0A7Y9NRE1_9BACT|nr:hypothetical protein [Edaphobacter lichenicola]
MIWFDVAVTLLLTLRMVLFGPTLPRLLDPENDSSSLVGNKGGGEPLGCRGEKDESLLSEIGLPIMGVLQLHIHVMPDLKGPR